MDSASSTIRETSSGSRTAIRGLTARSSSFSESGKVYYTDEKGAPLLSNVLQEPRVRAEPRGSAPAVALQLAGGANCVTFDLGIAAFVSCEIR
jgi:hypothetical protein